MNLYLVLLRAFLSKELFEKYWKHIDLNHVKENYPQLYKLYLCIPLLHSESTKDTSSVEDLALVFKTGYPSAKDDDYTPIFNQLQALQVEGAKVTKYLDSIQKRKLASQIAITALSVAEGTTEWESLANEITSVSTELPSVEEEEDDFDSRTLPEILAAQAAEPGLRWRLGSLNRALGSIRKGNFGFLFARPETGKTTLLASEATFMCPQTDRKIVWFNNEQSNDDVHYRIYQAALGKTLIDIKRDPERTHQEFLEATKGNFALLKDAVITRKRVEEVCRKHNPALIIFDQIDKIEGFAHDDRNDIELKNKYVWARSIAKTYCPVIAVCQAGMSGEGRRWLTMADVDNSKTGKQGEADFILGIGKVFDEGLANVRFLHLSKNKLLGDDDTDPSMRHGKWEVKIREDIARYEDF